MLDSMKRLLLKDNVNGLIVITEELSESQFTTWLRDRNSINPVEKYDDKNEAITGHKKWSEKARTLREVDVLMSTELKDMGPLKTQIKRFPVVDL